MELVEVEVGRTSSNVRSERAEGEAMSLRCPECGSTDIMKRGFNITRRGRVRRYQCKVCGRTFQIASGQPSG